jgi:broad specificity phosphatase PhoE
MRRAQPPFSHTPGGPGRWPVGPVAAILLLAALRVAGATPGTAETLRGEALVTALRQGGYTLYFRHAATEWSQADRVAAAGDWTSCDPTRMRQLSPQGRETAARIGAALRRLGIPVGRVRASEYCRTVETARLLDVGEVEATREIINLRIVEHLGGHDAVVARARKALSEPPVLGTNTVLVAHGNLMQAATGHYTLEAGAGVFAVREGALVQVASVAPEEWAALAERYGKPG